MIRYIVLVGLVCSHLCVHAQFAALGNGALKNQIWWFDWAGFNLTENASRTFNTTNGLTVTITFINVSKKVPSPDNFSTNSGTSLHRMYDFTDRTIKPALYSPYSNDTCRFTMKVQVSRAGIAIPFSFIVADAEESDIMETTTLVTDGSNWQTVEFFRNTTQTFNPLTGCNTRRVIINQTEGNAFESGHNPILSTSAVGNLQLQLEMNRHMVAGAMSVAFGIMSPVDRGDLPASFGAAMHQLTYTISNGCNYMTQLPVMNQLQTLKLGAVAGDADATQTADDNTIGVDEDGVNSFPVYKLNGQYSVQVNLANTTGATAWLTGWFDANRNGVFERAEGVTVPVTVNASAVTITWRNLPKYLPAGTMDGCGFRFRLSSGIIATQQPAGYAPDGEVEDYFVKNSALCAPAFAVDPSNATICRQQVAILAASGGDAYSWLEKDNTPIGSSAIIQVQPMATQHYRVRITEFTCNITDTFTIPIQVNELPIPAISKSNDIDCSHGKATLQARGGNSYNWTNTPGGGNVNANVVSTVVEPAMTTTYYVDVTNNKGCMVKDSVTVEVDFGKTASRYPVPTAFSPNNDGKNDCFSIKGWGRIKHFEMEVYNKWGQRVYMTTDAAQCWDGRLNGVPQSTGGYVYSIKASTTCGIVHQKGVVMLVR